MPSASKRKTTTKKSRKNGVKKPRLNRQNAILTASMLPERKSVSVALNFGDTLPVQAFGTMQAGDNAYQRNGRKVIITEIHLQGFVQIIANAVSPTHARLAIVSEPKDNTGAGALLTTDIWQSFTTGGSAITSFPSTSGRNLDRANRYNVLAQKKFYAGIDNNNLDTGSDQKIVSMHLRNLNIPQLYSGVNAADLQSGALYVMIIADKDVGIVGNAIVFRGIARAVYFDA